MYYWLKLTLAWVAAFFGVLSYAGLSYAQNIEYIGSFGTPDEAYGVFVENNYAYVADYDSGLLIIDISNPASPSLIASQVTPSHAMGVFVQNDYAYVADGYAGLQIINITNPANPFYVGSCDTPGYAWRVSISGNYAVVADASSIQIIDITNHATPFLAGSYDTDRGYIGVSAAGNYAYAADADSGLEIINFADPANPSLAGKLDTPGYSRNVFVAGNYAYVADDADNPVVNNNNAWIQIVDIVDPSNPSLAGSFSTFDYAWDVFVTGDYAYAAIFACGLQIINIADPANPVEVGRYDTPGIAYGIFARDNYVYVADDSSLIILRFTPTGIEEGNNLPDDFSLSQNYPNPFNAQTTIEYCLPEQSLVSIDIFDLLGRRIETLVDEVKPAGLYRVTWHADNLPSGMYFCRITAGDFSKTRKMVLLK